MFGYVNESNFGAKYWINILRCAGSSKSYWRKIRGVVVTLFLFCSLSYLVHSKQEEIKCTTTVLLPLLNRQDLNNLKGFLFYLWANYHPKKSKLDGRMKEQHYTTSWKSKALSPNTTKISISIILPNSQIGLTCQSQKWASKLQVMFCNFKLAYAVLRRSEI